VLGLFTAFARAGGLCVLPAAASSIVPSGIVEEQNHAGFDVRGWGQGRIAVAKQDWDDPYTAARDVHMLMSRRRDHPSLQRQLDQHLRDGRCQRHARPGASFELLLA
jgi:hypothetical protein